MTNLGLLHHFLGMRILQTDQGVFIHQNKYAKSLLTKFGLEDYKPVYIPLATSEKLKKVDGSELADEGLYRKIVGSLLYLTATKPDLMYATSLLSRFMNGPTKIHMGAAKRVLRYVQGTLSYDIEYVRDQSATNTTKRLMSSPKCRSVEVINNPARLGSNHKEVNCINYK